MVEHARVPAARQCPQGVGLEFSVHREELVLRRRERIPPSPPGLRDQLLHVHARNVGRSHRLALWYRRMGNTRRQACVACAPSSRGWEKSVRTASGSHGIRSPAPRALSASGVVSAGRRAGRRAGSPTPSVTTRVESRARESDGDRAALSSRALPVLADALRHDDSRTASPRRRRVDDELAACSCSLLLVPVPPRRCAHDAG